MELDRLRPQPNAKPRLRPLRDYQKRINYAVGKFIMESDEQRGQVYSPTGSGKTESFGHTVHDLPVLLNTSKRLSVLVVHPRIALSTDQLQRFRDMLGPDIKYISLHSGGGKAFEEEKSTLDFNDVKRDIAQSSEPMHITFTSYDSLKKVGSHPFDLIICDEAHNLTQSQYTEALAKLGGTKILFYTATPITSELSDDKDMEGMDSEKLFGKVIVAISPKELIEHGYIVPPEIHLMEVRGGKPAEGVNTTHYVAEAFKYQRKRFHETGMPFTQMLVATRGYDDHRKVEAQLDVLWRALGVRVPVFTIEADETRLNGQPYRSRSESLEEIREAGKSVIIMHYDTLSEGIDVSSLTGALILRSMTKAKLLQTIGRCGRPFEEDLDGRAEPVRYQDRLKPNSIITFPTIKREHISGLDAHDVAAAFKAGGYGDLEDYISDDS